MGGFCCRRQKTREVDFQADQLDEWLLIQPNRQRLHIWRKAVRKIVSLLAFRQVWSHLGRQLRDNGKKNGNAARRAVLGQVWSELGSRVRAVKELFNHLDRKGGKLRLKS